MGHGANNMKVSRGVAQEVTPQVAQGDEGVSQETEGLPHEIENALVLIPLLGLFFKKKKKKKDLTLPPI